MKCLHANIIASVASLAALLHTLALVLGFTLTFGPRVRRG